MERGRSRSENPSQPIRFRAGDRVFCVGASGSGKTSFMLALLNKLWTHYKVPTWIVNSKPDDTITDLGLKTGTWLLRDDPPKPIRHFGLQIWRPTRNDPDLYDAYFESILELGVPGILLVDEVLSLPGSTNRYPRNFEILIAQVRSKKITMIYGAQRKAGVPAMCLNQATHVMMFNLRDEYDQRTVGREMRLKDSTVPDEHGFYYTRLDKIGPVYYFKEYQEFFAPRKERAHVSDS